MKTLCIDPVGGLAGDMLCAALFDAGLDFEHWKAELKKLAIPLPQITLETVQRGAFRSAHFSVHNPKNSEQAHSHPHGHSSHQHHHTHDTEELEPVDWEEHHRSWKKIKALITHSQLDSITKKNALLVFEKLAEAEAKIHGTAVEDVRFHEVGAIDSIVDIVGFCLGCRMLGIEQIFYAPPPISGGLVWSAHGKIPLPAPATLELIKGMKTRKGITDHEQVTPTGAAIISVLGRQEDFPNMKIIAAGYGAGTRNPSQYANIVRLSIGELATKELETNRIQDSTPTDIIEIQSNIDDMSGEALPFLQEQLFLKGALDVCFQSIFMKKGRPAWLLTVLLPTNLLEKITHCIFEHSTSFGIRYIHKKRLVLEREFQTIETTFGAARIKKGTWKDIEKISVEYEDMKRIAQAGNISLKQSQELILQQWKQL